MSVLPPRLGAVLRPLAIALLAATGCLDGSKTAVCPTPPGAPGSKPLATCSNGTKSGDEGLVDDFDDGDTQLAKQGGREGYWFVAKDPAGSSIGPSPLTMTDGGPAGSKKALHVFGNTVSENGAWGAQVGAHFLSSNSVYDASQYAGISFFAKVAGNSTKKVRFKVGDINTDPDGGVCKTCWNHFGKDMTLTPEWQEYKITFAEMKQEAGWGEPRAAITPSKLLTINWSVGPGLAYDLWFDNVQFFECQ